MPATIGVLLVLVCLDVTTIGVAEIMEKGVNFEHCREANDCEGFRVCVGTDPVTNEVEVCGSTTTNCVCFQPVTCESSGECDKRERCFRLSDGNTTCATCRLDVSVAVFIDEDPETCEGVWPGGYNGDRCTFFYRECAPGRECRELYTNGWGFCSFSTAECFCYEPSEFLEICDSSSECILGEQCAQYPSSKPGCLSCHRVAVDDDLTAVNENDDDGAKCNLTEPNPSPLSPEPEMSARPPGQVPLPPDVTITPEPDVFDRTSPSPSQASSPPLFQSPTSNATASPAPCVAARDLEHLPPSALVFPRHLRASVLCDPHDSCATPGHIVIYKNIPMMMASYCARVRPCQQRVMQVNSPRFRVAMRITSRTSDLCYTPHAARYETRLEELAIRALVSIGLWSQKFIFIFFYFFPLHHKYNHFFCFFFAFFYCERFAFLRVYGRTVASLANIGRAC